MPEKNPFAFPNETIDSHTEYGMTLRDYFAAKAMITIIKNGTYELAIEKKETQLEPFNAGIAKLCYDLADAMLRERSN